jgi:hypothetical protein
MQASRLMTGIALIGIFLLPAFARAQQAPGLKPMSFLAGHCWKGTFPGSAKTDEHCFQWIYGGTALRDTHTVRAAGEPDYVGETTYYWNPAMKRVEFLYIENLGGSSRGTMEPGQGVLTFPATEYVDNDSSLTYRARWTPIGDDAYEAWSEAKVKDGWTTLFRVKLTRAP